MKTNKCNRCGKELPATEFYKNRSRKDGLAIYCKKCHNEMLKKNKPSSQSKGIEPQLAATPEKERLHKVYTNKDLAVFEPRDLMLELKARGYVGELVYEEVIRKVHRISLANLN